MLCACLDGKEYWGEWTHAHVWRSPFAVYPKLSQRCELAIVLYKIKSLELFFNKQETAVLFIQMSESLRWS